jgi:hypothetical protein
MPKGMNLEVEADHITIGKRCGCDGWNGSLRRSNWYIQISLILFFG